jgi:hypothetical protein
MPEIAEWNDAVEYKAFLKSARENVELMKARYVDLMVSRIEWTSWSLAQTDAMTPPVTCLF